MGSLSLTPSLPLSLSLFISLSRARSLDCLLFHPVSLSLSRSSCLHNQDGVDGSCRLVLPIERTGNGGYNSPQALHIQAHDKGQEIVKRRVASTNVRRWVRSLSLSLSFSLSLSHFRFALSSPLSHSLSLALQL